MSLQLQQFLKLQPAAYIASYFALFFSSALLWRAFNPLLENGEVNNADKPMRSNKPLKQAPPGSKSVLVFGSTGRVGSNICDQLVALGLNVCGTTRSVPSAKLESKGVTPIKFQFGNAQSAEEAIRISDAQLVYILTDFYNAAGQNKQTEITHGKIIIDAIKKVGGVEHVIFQSIADVDICPDNIDHFKSKLVIEDYLKQSGLSYSILRPVAFFENLDDPANYNPLKKGMVKGLWSASTKLKMVACVDIANAAAKVFAHPKSYRSKTIDCASCEVDGRELSDALSAASGVKCEYAEALPRFVMKWFMKDVFYMVEWFETTGYSSNIEEFKLFIPNALGPKEWFEAKGKWANGEKFTPK